MALTLQSKKSRTLPELTSVPLNNVWHKAASKNTHERQEGLDGLSLLFLLFEDALDLRVNTETDSLDDIETLLTPEPVALTLVEEFCPPRDKLRAGYSKFTNATRKAAYSLVTY
jgi:hypothetical protein